MLPTGINKKNLKWFWEISTASLHLHPTSS